MPQLGATFVPGGYDDYYMPEVVAPAPQRVMPEVPQNMQEDLQRLELSAEGPRVSIQSIPPANAGQQAQHYRGDEFANWHNQSYAAGAAAAQAAPPVPEPSNFKAFRSDEPGAEKMDAPTFSPFPKVKGENIPPSDIEKEEILWKAKAMVLHSNNVPMQISWARDTLMWVEMAAEAAARDWKRDGKGRERPATPKVEHELRVDAVNIIEFLAAQGHPDALFMKGKWQEFGKFGYRENKKDAYLSYKAAADQGCGRAEYRMAMLYENSNDIEKAIKHYRIGAEQLNDSASNYRLGMLYLMGQHGFQRDYTKGLELINKAADTADEDAPQGAYVYGMIISRELPDITLPEGMLPYEVVVARQYIAKAAYLGFAKAQLKMGQAYELSQLGCDFNPSYSLHYYGLAARQGQPEAALGVSRWFLFGSQDGSFTKNEQLAFKYAQDAATTGLATGEFAMGYYYEVGIHVQIDLREARKWYELAAEHGNKDAMSRIEGLNQSKSLTKQDHETTTLTRIKSQHGSQRGKRPERFTSRQNDVMPAVAEDNAPPIPGKTMHENGLGYPQANLAVRPKSAAPYPEDDRPPALNLRPHSVAPYPEDDSALGRKPPPSPHYNPAIRPSAGAGPGAGLGPQSDRPGSSFGIRPSSPGGPAPYPNDPRTGRLPPNAAAAAGWEPQRPAGYRQSSPGPNRQDYGYRGSSPARAPYPQNGGPNPNMGGIPPAGTPIGDPTRNRLQKNPKPQPLPQGPAPNQFPMGGGAPYPAQHSPTHGGMGAQPGREYGAPRPTNRPVSDAYGYASVPPAAQGARLSSGPTAYANGAAGYRHDRVDSMPTQGGRVSSGPQGAGLPKPRPGQLDSMAGRAGSAPPAQMQNFQRPNVGSPAPPSVASTPNLPGHGHSGGRKPTDHPDGKTIGNGPATFEEMGIPNGKSEGDCVVM